jgi:hypothetical protein
MRNDTQDCTNISPLDSSTKNEYCEGVTVEQFDVLVDGIPLSGRLATKLGNTPSRT